MTGAELRLLLRDCLLLWDVQGRVAAIGGDGDGVGGEGIGVGGDGIGIGIGVGVGVGVAIEAPDGTYKLQRAPPGLRPVRWLVQTPVRAAAGRPPRAAPSIVAALSTLRNAIGAAGGASLRIGAQ